MGYRVRPRGEAADIASESEHFGNLQLSPRVLFLTSKEACAANPTSLARRLWG